MKDIDYSVVIRTLGNAGEKYQVLLNSILRQKIKPREVIVVIPYGYELPKEQLGIERFVRSEKGMIIQRVVGAYESKSKYCLFLDDDVCFREGFIEKLIEPILQERASITFPILRDILPVTKKAKFMMACLGTAVPCESKNYFTRIIRTGGYSYNPATSFCGWYKAETAPGACFLCEKSTMLNIKFEEEVWLERAGYPIPEDQVMFYKFYKFGYNIIGVGNLDFVHLDAGGNNPNRDKKATFAMSCNKTIFWHRFIWKTDRNKFSRIVSFVCFSYSTLACLIYLILKACIGRRFDLLKCFLLGYKQAYIFLKSEEYKQIPHIKVI